MRTETIGEYEIECSGVRLPGSDEWAAHLVIHGPSSNPMHLNEVFPEQRVCGDAVFPDAVTAEAEARKVAILMVEKVVHPDA
jgi:hypothetical protein